MGTPKRNGKVKRKNRTRNAVFEKWLLPALIDIVTGLIVAMLIKFLGL